MQERNSVMHSEKMKAEMGGIDHNEKWVKNKNRHMY